MRKTIRIVILIIAVAFIVDGILGFLEVTGPFIDFYRSLLPGLFGR